MTHRGAETRSTSGCQCGEMTNPSGILMRIVNTVASAGFLPRQRHTAPGSPPASADSRERWSQGLPSQFPFSAPAGKIER
jgi:hypothetical protein